MTDTIARPGYSGDSVAALARDYAVQVRDPRAQDAKWLWLRGLTKFSPKPEHDLQDDSDLDGEGYASEISTGIGLTVEMEGKRKSFPEDAGLKPDAGQQLLKDKSTRTGYENLIDIRYWRTDNLDEAQEFTMPCAYTEDAPGINDLLTFSVSGKSRGKPRRIKRPTDSDAASVYLTEDGEVVQAIPREFKTRITMPTGMTAGTWTITIGGETTTGIEYNASSSAVAAAINDLSGVDGATVSGGHAAGYVVTYTAETELTAAKGDELDGDGDLTVAADG